MLSLKSGLISVIVQTGNMS